jgi:hypothetical protein
MMRFLFHPSWAILAQAPATSMKRILAAVLTAMLGVGMTLVAMLVLVRATLTVARMSNPLLWALAVVAELVLGVVLLVGTVYMTTRLAVRIFGVRPSEPRS